MNKINKIYTLLVLIFSIIFIQNIDAQKVKKSEYGTYLLKNGTLHTVSSGTKVGDILLKDGVIAQMGTNLPIGADTKVIDCTGKHIYPGLIDGGCRLGLVEISSVSLTNDYSDVGDFIPHMKALTAVNPNAVAIPVTVVNGVTTVFAKPEGSTFAGTGALIDLHGYNPDQMYAGSERVVMTYPSTGRRGRWDRRSDEDLQKDADKARKNINAIWENATTYMKMDSAATAEGKKLEAYNPQMEALLPIIKKEQPLFIEVNAKSDIESALEWVSENKVLAVFTGVSEGYRVADKIAKANIPVITGPVLSVPKRDNDRYDAAYTNPSKMLEAGVKVALRTNHAENVRNLPFEAGFAATYGMGIENALRSVTLTPAEIFGVADKYGSLDKGKVANVIIADGDPFETKTKIEYVFIRGWNIPMESRQTLLYDEFLQREPGIK